jgi:nitrous oxidase accessory protein NosD
MRKRGVLVIFVFALLLSVETVHAGRTIWYVHPDSALNTIQTGLGSCADNDIVLVAPGMYVENIVWPNTQGIHLVSELGPEVTIVDGNSDGAVIWIATAVDTTTIINGFTIQHGSAGCGGIVCYNNTSPTIMGNTIIDNDGMNGGGIFVGPGCSPVISNNSITSNSAGWAISGRGGGIFCDSNSQAIILGNTITDNCALCSWDGSGGGISLVNASPSIDSCLIAYNDDGVYCADSSAPEIHYCDILDNTGYGVCNVDTGVTVDADSNWWGDASGPYHPTANPGGLGDTVSDCVDFYPWLISPGVEEQPIVKPVETHKNLGATVFSGPLQLPEGKQCKVFDITGRVVEPNKIQPGIYFIEIDGIVLQKVVKVR